MQNSKNYKAKDVEMLIGAQTIARSLNENLSELSAIRSTWTVDYASDLQDRIDNVTRKYLGIDKKKDLREATGNVQALMQPAIQDISFLKTQLEVDFGPDSGEVLKRLGLKPNLKDADIDKQEPLIEVLHAYGKGMTPELKAMILEKGTNEVLLDRIAGYADQIMAANLTQESLKETSKEITYEARATLNGIYEEVIGICKIASAYYKNDEIRKNQFTFSKVVANMSAS